MSPREDHQTKGRRYVLEGRLVVRLAGPQGVRAICRGQGHWYELGWERGPGWWCSCPAATRCAHLVALQLVTTAPSGPREDQP
jgi:hypothetical protein